MSIRSEKPVLAIISHTDHYVRDGRIVGWEPTIREINNIAGHFTKIYHAAVLHPDEAAPASAAAYEAPNVEFVPLKPHGGQHFFQKMSVLTTMPANIRTVAKVLKKADWVQFRSPTSMGVYLLPWLSFGKRPGLWVKYAGNWVEENPPRSYAFQRWWLKNNFQKSKVTINGRWPGQESHLLSFENPCFTNQELADAHAIASVKNYSGKLTVCFVGRTEEEKGLGILLDSLSLLKQPDALEKIIVVGNGPQLESFKEKARTLPFVIDFKGAMGRAELNDVYTQSHIFCLPSYASEGFPKVIAEAASFGCVPVVSSVSSVTQFVRHNDNGIIIQPLTPQGLADSLDALFLNRSEMSRLAMSAVKIGELFTYSRYSRRIFEEIINAE